jgi:hypothetical protein
MSALTAELALTRDDIIAALSTRPLPFLLHDVLDVKMMRGDGDCDTFKRLATYQFGSGLNATAGGALWAMQCWTKKGQVNRTPEIIAFMADLEAVETFGRAAA